jgi:hypothetical protein
VYRRILGPAYEMKKKRENWRILTDKKFMQLLKKNPTVTETVRLHRLCWFGHAQRVGENGIPKRVL